MWINLHYGIMIFFLVKSDEKFSIKEAFLFGILAFLY